MQRDNDLVMDGDSEELFVFGTQVQAGVDEHVEREKTRGLWRARLSEYALGGEAVDKEMEREREREKSVKQRVGKTKRVRGRGATGVKERGKGKEKGKGKGQRLFGSINRETIRAHTWGEEGVHDDESGASQRVYSQDEWMEVHGRIVEALIGKKRVIEWEEGEEEEDEEEEEEEGDDVRLRHWTPPPLCAAESKALYGDGLVDEVDESVCGVSGVFTLSQVLGERGDGQLEGEPREQREQRGQREQREPCILVVSDSGEESEGVIIRVDDSVVVEKVVEVDNTSEEAEVIVLSDSDGEGEGEGENESESIEDSKEGIDAVREALSNESLWKDVVTYKPVSVKAVCAVAEMPASEVRKGLDKLGVCWVE